MPMVQPVRALVIRKEILNAENVRMHQRRYFFRDLFKGVSRAAKANAQRTKILQTKDI